MKKHALSRADFARLQRKTERRVHGKFFSVVVATREKEEGSKFACVVSKKVARKAADRNRIKRACRAAIRAALPDSGRARSFAFYAKQGAAAAANADVSREIAFLMHKISVT